MPASGGMMVEIEALGVKHIQRRITRVGARAAGETEAGYLWFSIWGDLLYIEKVQFLTQGRGQWDKLADSTQEQKARRGESPWIERATEALFQSLTQSNSEQIREVAGSWMRFGTKIPYAPYQQRGTSKMPQRKLIDLREVERRAIVKSIQLFLLTGEIRSIVGGAL